MLRHVEAKWQLRSVSIRLALASEPLRVSLHEIQFHIILGEMVKMVADISMTAARLV
jgi:hypothetical protein